MHASLLLTLLCGTVSAVLICPSPTLTCGMACYTENDYCCISGQLKPKSACPKPNTNSRAIVFQDDFNDLDMDVWKHEITAGGGGNWEFQYYTNNRSNSYVRDGIFYIKPTLTEETIGRNQLKTGGSLNLWGGTPADLCTSNANYGCERAAGGGGSILNPIQSAAVRTAESFSINKPCTVEVRAKLPKGDWIWPAIWMLPKHNSYGNWPASGEIDIMESRGNAPGYPSGGYNSFGSTLHWGPYTTANRYSLTHKDYTLPQGNFNQDFHIFGLQWSNDSIVTYLDDPKNVILNVPFDKSFWERGQFPNITNNPWVGRSNAAPFDREFYLIMNVAVGGVSGYFPDKEGGKPWSDKRGLASNDFYAAKSSWYSTWTGEDAALQVDWVKVYKD